MDRLAVDNLLQKAFSLAFFIHGDKETAIRVVVGALTKLEVAATAQYKRLYYTPIGRLSDRRTRGDRLRNKVSFNDSHLLQRLILVESEAYERQKEMAKANSLLRCGEEDMVIFFIKHLVRITTKRNSFYVTLGLSRLLYNYSTVEAMEIYNLVVQDPERVKDDYYYRSRKALLMREIKERFGNLVNICRGPRGEERFHAEDSSETFAGLVKAGLSLFTPWDTRCLVPLCFDPSTKVISPLSDENNKDESKVEVDRIHAVLHPECFARLIEALGLDDPTKRLRVPHFYLSQDRSNGEWPPDRRVRPPRLEEDEIFAINGELSQQAERRRAFSAGLLRILVDGIERGRLELKRSSCIGVKLDRSAELIEIRAGDSDDNLLLATYLLTDYETSSYVQPLEAGITLEGGHKLSISIYPSENAHLAFKLVYGEVHRLKVLSQRLSTTLLDLLRSKRPSYHGVAAVVWSLFFLIVGVVGVELYLQRNRQRIEQRAGEAKKQASLGDQNPSTSSQNKRIAQTTEKPVSDIPTSGTKALRPDGNRTTRRSRQLEASTISSRQNRSSEGKGPPTEGIEGIERETTRDLRPGPAVTSLAAIKNIYVAFAEGERSNQAIRAMLVEKLRKQTRFVVVSQRDDAEAMLKLNVRRQHIVIARRLDNPETGTAPKKDEGTGNIGSEKVSVLVQLVNANGDVIWPSANGRIKAKRYEGSVASVTTKIVDDLISETKEPKR